jgi:hypothetical protein
MRYRIVKIKPGFYGYKTLQPFQYGLEIKHKSGNGYGLLGCYIKLSEAEYTKNHCIKMDKALGK